MGDAGGSGGVATFEFARNGVRKYSYSRTVICSIIVRSELASMSKTVIEAIALKGSTSTSLMCTHEYVLLCSATWLGLHPSGVITVVPAQSHPAAKHSTRADARTRASHARQLGAEAQERLSVARRPTLCPHARFTCANLLFTKPFSLASAGT